MHNYKQTVYLQGKDFVRTLTVELTAPRAILNI